LNPDKALIRRFQADPGRPLPIESNALAMALGGVLLAADGRAGRVSLQFTPDASFLQGDGDIHGGIVATMLDFAAAFAAFARLPDGQAAATVNLGTSYLAAVPQGRLRAEAHVERMGRRLAYVRAELREAGGEDLLATAQAVLAVITDRA
jgi:uncharacterized protein (TIGR00369 family)